MNLEQILQLPIEKKIGQLFFIGISGTELDEKISGLIDRISPGGICLFARNMRTAEQVRSLIDDIRSSSEIAPFFSLDQEGGLVDRLRRISTPMPAASAIKNIVQAESLARITAEIIRILGFNMNFAPVVDVVDEERSRFPNGLHSRAFGKSKEEVVELAGSYLHTLQMGGIIGCLKHFPGLGGARKDAHDELPSIDISAEELQNIDLFPYRELFGNQSVSAVMVAHTCFPMTDLQETDQNGKLLPTSLSFGFVTKLLRDELGFKGIAITDDLEMGAVVNDFGIGEACKMAINAGEDMLAICANADVVVAGFEAVVNAVSKGEISESRIDESLRRIFEVKKNLPAPVGFDSARLHTLSENVSDLCDQVKYTYGG